MYLKFNEAGKLSGEFLGMAEVPARPGFGDANGMTTSIRFKRGSNNFDELTSRSKKLIGELAKYHVGDVLELTRSGKGLETTYSVVCTKRATL